ncbi:CYTH and CHAD domain-containing protein [Nocardia vaccinii]|uniref:CYTH and CHAD domain-containing protein n=1 Tax=Nocardia vaccinii TaxID=1822 RepID=UPI00082E6607|nr:CYTH and CHAD domain-containing protein [Nocardia vaccinii]
MVTRANETERKYRLPDKGGAALDDIPGITLDPSAERQVLDAVYYDTADFALAGRGVTLRRRTGGDDAGWHVKLPLEPGGDSREEIRVPLGDATADVPGELADIVRGIAKGEPLTPVAHIRTERRQWRLLDAQGDVTAELVADEVSAQTLGESSTVESWQEAEVELAGGDRTVFDAVETRLGKPLDSRPKLLRLLGDRVTPRPLPKRAVARYFRTQVDEMIRQDTRVRQEGPDSVHRMRVAGRRLRSILQAFKGSRSLRDELKWVAGVLGEVRDIDVLHGHLVEQIDALPEELVLGDVRRRVTRTFAGRRATAYAHVLDALNSERYFTLLGQLEQVDSLPVDRKRETEALRQTRRRVERAFGRIEGLGTDRGLHEVRKAAKRSRYAAEATGHRKHARRMKKLQKLLGDHHDSVVARGELRALGIQAHLAGGNGFTYGLLYGQEAARAAALEQSLDRTARERFAAPAA